MIVETVYTIFMCEIFGYTSNEELELNPWLTTFFSHANKNQHGWGLVNLDESCPRIEKEPINALDSMYLKSRLKSTYKAHCALAHIRDATIGHMEYNNCHPFTMKDHSGRNWTLVHNGTIFDFPLMNRYLSEQEGQTDSERILYYIVGRINQSTQRKGSFLTSQERFRVISHVLMHMARKNKLNILLYDEENLYVHTNYKNSLYMKEIQQGLMFATKPLDNQEWKPVPFMRVLAYQKGQLLYSGMPHSFEYLDDPKAMEMLYLAYSSL